MTFERLCTALFVLGVASAASFMPAQNDTWWHLRAGEEIWRTGTASLSDSFSHTAAGNYWPNHEWLSQLLFYGLYRLGGMPLLTAFCALLVTATWLIVWQLTSASPVRRLLLSLVGVIPTTLAWSIRPQVLSLFFVALTALLLFRRRFSLLPLVFVLWANLHGAVLLGIVLVTSVAMGTALRDWRAARPLLIVALLCIVATTITPLGLSFWTEIPASLVRIDPSLISEWRRPRLMDPALLPFWVMAATLCLLVVSERPWHRATTAGNGLVWGALAMLPLALTSARNIPPFVVLAVPAIALLYGLRSPETRPTRIRIERPAFNVAVLVSLSIVAAGSIAHAWTAETKRLGWHPLPPEAIAAVAACPEHLYNRYDEGGYLIWFVPSRKVFLDSRYYPYPLALIREHVRVETSGDYRSLFERHGIRCAFIPADSLLRRRLVEAGWRLQYEGVSWVVLADESSSTRDPKIYSR